MKLHSRIPVRRYPQRVCQTLAVCCLLVCFGMAALSAYSAETVFSEDFESFTDVAKNLEDTADADPARPDMAIADDAPVDGAAETGVQVIDWQVHSGNNALLVRSGAEAQAQLYGALSGNRYQLDFWLYTLKGSGDRNFLVVLRGEGSDYNGDDYLAYRSDRGATTSLWYYDGVGPGAAAWVNSGASHADGAWQHHRIVIDPNALTFSLYLDNMDTPVLEGAELSRCEVAVPTVIRIVNEGNSADDGYFVIDDVSLTVEGSRDLTAAITEGFESYTARTTAEDDADPAGPWITTEIDGTGSGKDRRPAKVQVVGSDVVAPHSGSQCLKIEGGQRAGVSLAWGVPPQSDVQITWWARVPISAAGATANYLRMSLYGSEDGNAIAGDNALLGYGSRQAGIGDETSLTYYVTGWLDSGVNYTPDTWEQYRLITHTSKGQYTIIKNPSSANPEIVVDHSPFVGTATKWGSSFMAAWSSSNGSGHPPVYIDDIEVKTYSAGSVFSEDFESFTDVAKNLEDTADADPARPDMVIADDAPVDGAAETGVQVIDWQVHSGKNALLVRSGAEAQAQLYGALSGSRYQLDFWLYTLKGSGDRNFYIILRGEGSDYNGDDYLAYRSDRGATTGLWYYDGVGPGAAAWVDSGVLHADGAWQHHRIVIDPNALTFSLYLDNMDTPVLEGAELSRCEVAVPTVIRIVNEGNSADDGYFVIDDISLTVEQSRDLTAKIAEGFESYTARTTAEEDADPAGPWITTEVDGTGSGKDRTPAKVQVVGSDVVPPHSGSKCLKIEGGQRAGISLAWGVPPQSDVQITWWARVPASVAGATANYLRMSLYGPEDGNAIGGDNALLGYGSRQPGLGDETSLTYYVTGWLDSGIDYTPDTWEQYRLITHTSQGRYTIIKNPNSANPEIVVDRSPFVGTATKWGSSFMAAWSSSNGSGHPPVYIDDIEVESIVSVADPLPEPYTVSYQGTRFTNVSVLNLTGPIGDMAVDPRDNSTIVFAVDAASSGGALYCARKTAPGIWTVDPAPVVSALSNPSGVVIATDGTLWWTHDYTMALMRLKAPWSNNVPERMIMGFGDPSAATADDDPIDLAIAPNNFNGAIGKPGMIVIADRGSDGDANNAVYYFDPASNVLDQTDYASFLYNPTPGDLGAGNLNAIVSLPQSGEVLTLSQDGFLTAINADGAIRNIWPPTLWADLNGPAPAGVAAAVDPTTGRLWIADDLLDEIWSVSTAAANPEPDQKEISFPLTNPNRPERQIDFNDPGMAFAPNGDFMVVSDTSTANGGGRLLIFHNQVIAPPTFRIQSVAATASGVQLEWETVQNATYRVQRSASITDAGSFQDIASGLTTASFTDTNAPTGTAFYRVIATR